MERYQELIDSCIYPGLIRFNTAAQKAQSMEELQLALTNTNAPVINFLNTKYVIFNPEVPPLINPNALGNAWFVETPVIVENANEEIAMVAYFNPAEEAAIDKIFKDQITKTSYPVLEDETIELVSYQPDELVYKTSAKEEKLAVFSEIYYPAGWKCFIDGNESRYFRADWILRGMIIPSGEHEIKFTFRPSSYYVGNKVSLASSILLIILFAGYIFTVIKSKSE